MQGGEAGADQFDFREIPKLIELLGRYERCDTHGATVFAHHGISRVHLLVVEVEGAVYAVDTGSTNGTFHGDDEVRIVPLASGTELVFGDGLARMEWMPP